MKTNNAREGRFRFQDDVIQRFHDRAKIDRSGDQDAALAPECAIQKMKELHARAAEAIIFGRLF
ncbi:hypothetical protein IHQ71_18735 [Rhizobium sp. TH2]|uniref:hypothetical protein n=1 Tax=Rhizobium sp. TH2 TaxID=2775403 RepID=UPI0021584C12|nr:hypothetical protein [Rhizobium sp. TH2]UVC07243.1 hypothetical protein IHQ71_18735 [Rhizobium sp. TH2]